MARACVAVTGASGFIGGHVTRALIEKGFRVRALIRRPPTVLTTGEGASDDIAWVKGSLDDMAALENLVSGADAVIHLAGAIKALRRAEFFHHNVKGLGNLTAAILAAAPRCRLVHVSSLAAREPGLSDYAASKRAAEQALRPLAGRMALAVLRLPAVYGPGDMETLRLFKMAASGWVMVPAMAHARMSLIHAADAAAAIVALVHAPGPGAISDTPASGPEPIEVDDGAPGGHDWAAIAAAAIAAARPDTRSKARIVAVPMPVLRLAGLVGSAVALVTGRPSLLSWSKAAEMAHPDWCARTTPIAGFQPRWSLGNGFKDAVNWAVSRGLLKSYS